jgi:glycosyltransferase involved in cell wall biosynthesis
MTLTVLVNAGPWLSVPPHGYGGLENVVATLVPELRRRGIRIVLATIGESRLAVDEMLTTFPEARFADLTRPYNTVAAVAHAHMALVIERLRAGDIDLVHDNLEVVGPAMLAALPHDLPPALHTLHWDPARAYDFYTVYDGRGRVFVNAVSDAQLSRAPAQLQAQALSSVPLAAPIPDTPPLPMDAREPYVLVLGRISPLKGQHLAVHACHKAGVPLILAGPVATARTPDELSTGLSDGTLSRNTDLTYWLDGVAPYVDGKHVRWIGAVGGDEKQQLLAEARALLMPVQWEEPGATVVAEAFAVGTPVVGTARGCLPSLIDDGVTGRLVSAVDPVETAAQLAAALDEVPKLDPEACRRTAQERLSPARMADNYLRHYHEVLRRTGRQVYESRYEHGPNNSALPSRNVSE